VGIPKKKMGKEGKNFVRDFRKHKGRPGEISAELAALVKKTFARCHRFKYKRGKRKEKKTSERGTKQ